MPFLPRLPDFLPPSPPSALLARRRSRRDSFLPSSVLVASSAAPSAPSGLPLSGVAVEPVVSVTRPHLNPGPAEVRAWCTGDPAKAVLGGALSASSPLALRSERAWHGSSCR